MYFSKITHKLDNIMSPRKKKDSVATFARRLTELRKGRQLTQAELAEKLDMSRSIIAYYEASAKNPTLGTLSRMADFFGVSISELTEEYGKNGKPGPVPMLDRQIERVKKLSPAKQKMVSKIIEATLQT
jgi:transcriptional regulator with XRE-family HTH domain